jgi:hypothetical protein
MKTRQIIKQILAEETKLTPYIRRRFTAQENDIINQFKKEALRNFKSGKSIGEIIVKSSMDAAYEFLDPIDEWRDLPQKESVIILKDLNKLIYEKYGDIVKEYLNNFFDEKNDKEDGYRYIFHKHENSNGTGNGFADSFDTWNDLVRRFGSWFPDLNWNEIKSKLDEKDGQASILIKKPKDLNNNMGYYFSVRKQPIR